ncbi:MAG: hypothetical protein QW220_04430 [Candidatus Bathyarchaeia archaeon]
MATTSSEIGINLKAMDPYGDGSIRFDRFGSLSESFNIGRARMTVVDEAKER